MESLLLESSPRALDSKVNELVASGDDAALLDIAAELPDLVANLRASAEDRFDVGLAVENAGALAAIALRRNKRGVASATLDAMLAAYRLGDVKAEHASDEDVRLFEATAAALWALGAVAARAGDWALVRAIVAAEPADGGYYDSWLRHGQVMSARRATDSEDDNALNMPERQLALHPGYGMTEGGPDQRLLALCVFDQLALLVVASGLEPGERVNYYPSYAKYPAEYVEGTVIELRTEGPMRTAIFPGSNEHLREMLRDTNEMAVLQAAQFRDQGRDWSYRGYLDPRTWVFIRDGQMWESWRAIRG